MEIQLKYLRDFYSLGSIPHIVKGARIIPRSLMLGGLMALSPMAGTVMAHGLIQEPPSRNWYCGALTKPDQVNNGTAQYPVCGKAFKAPGLDPNAGYNFMSVLTHTRGYAVLGARKNVCGYDSETWQGAPTVWDQPIDWPTNRMSAGPKTFVWNIAWGPHFSDTQEFRYWITKDDFVYQVGKPLSFADFESEPFCTLSYSDSNPTANPAVIPNPGNSTFTTKCTLPNRSGRHVIYAEWGRNHYTYERFHGCVDALFDGGISPNPELDARITLTPAVSELVGSGSLTLDGSQSIGEGLSYQWSIESSQPTAYRLERGNERVATLHYDDIPAVGNLRILLNVRDGAESDSEILTLVHQPAVFSNWRDLGLLSGLAQPLQWGDRMALRTVTEAGIDALWPSQPIKYRKGSDWTQQLAQVINGQNGPVRLGVLNSQGEVLMSQNLAENRLYAASSSDIASVFLKVTPVNAGSKPTITPRVAQSSPWYHESQILISHAKPITALRVKITFQSTPGWSLNSLYNTVGDTIRQSTSSSAKGLTYQFVLQPGQTLTPGQNRLFAAQANGSGSIHPVAGDSYSVTYTVEGVSRTTSGRF